MGFLLGLTFGAVALVIYLFFKKSKLEKKTAELQGLLNQKELDHKDRLAEFQKERESIRKDAKMRSGAVNWGKTIENFVPFMDDFPVPPEDVIFLGMPIDYVGFTHTGSKTKCTIHFIEVKSGNSHLLDKQKNIKKAIEEGRVMWHEVRVEGNKLEEE